MKAVKIKVTIEQEINSGLRYEASIIDIVFPEFNRLLSYEEIAANVKTALSALKGFRMLTIDIIVNDDMTKSCRFVKEYDGSIKRAEYSFHSYNKWLTSNKAEIYRHLKSFVEIANVKFIEIVKTK